MELVTHDYWQTTGQHTKTTPIGNGETIQPVINYMISLREQLYLVKCIVFINKFNILL